MDDVRTVEGDHKIRDESVEVDSNVGTLEADFCGRQESDVTPASCPIKRASNVTEKS